jgi:putative oxidoreductase
MKSYSDYLQLYIRLALGIGFIYPVLDRTGFLGPADGQNIGWGNWESFLDYTHLLVPYLSRSMSDICGWFATIAETVFGIMLLLGFKTRVTAIGSGLLLLGFAVSMAIFLGFKAPFNYSVFSASAGAFLLAGVAKYSWSIDELFSSENHAS